mgnify:CR=1 FL=1
MHHDCDLVSFRYSFKDEFPQAFVYIWGDINRAVKVLYEQNMCHNDIKPGNIFVARHEGHYPVAKVLFYATNFNQEEFRFFKFNMNLNY